MFDWRKYLEDMRTDPNFGQTGKSSCKTGSDCEEDPYELSGNELLKAGEIAEEIPACEPENEEGPAYRAAGEACRNVEAFEREQI